MMDRLAKRWVDHPGSDFIVVVTIVGIAVLGARNGVDPLADLDQGSRHGLAQVLAGVGGALLGFGVTAVSILFAVTPGPRLARLMAHVGYRLNHVLVSSLAALAICTVGFVVAIPADTAQRASTVRFVVIGLFVLVILRVSRLLWIVAQVLHVFAAEAREAVSPSPIDRTWTPPSVTESDYEQPAVQPLARPRRRRPDSR